MAYPEKRGKYWRVRYQRADGTWASATRGDDGARFESKDAAKDYGEEQEADIRRNLWRDPRAGDTLLKDWANRWYNAQDLEETTLSGYAWHLEVHILPYFGDVPLRLLNALDIAAWEISLWRNGVCGKTSAASARTLLHTILEDAIPEGMLAANPAARRRNRGKKAGRSRTRGPKEIVATPLEVLLIAERASLLSGREDEFTHLLTIAYTGMRWAESIGLEREYFHLSTIQIEQQLYEHRGRWLKKPPKDDSYRELAIPPFLSDLLSRQVQRNGNGSCSCNRPGKDRSKSCGGGRFVFLAEDGGHERRSNFGRRRFRPAADGRHADAKERPGYPVLADLAETSWPGRVRRSWPAAIEGEEFEPPKRRGFWSYDIDVHHVVSWLAVKLGLKIHGLRHGHKVWLDEDDIPIVAVEERLGHELPGIVGTYSQTSPAMVRRIVEALQRRWERSLRERAAMYGGRSPVPLLDELLKPHREIISRDDLPKISQSPVTDLRERRENAV